MSRFNAALVKTEASLSQVENTAQVHQGNQAASDGRMRVPAELSTSERHLAQHAPLACC